MDPGYSSAASRNERAEIISRPKMRPKPVEGRRERGVNSTISGGSITSTSHKIAGQLTRQYGRSAGTVRRSAWRQVV
ncbi:hypothetical protein MAPG_05796 [Magnaporthiopsis poae ATCC 64411]|uniref:Uncharacterized protein n=1 Tax=Magnaporthiopsis poae (strain ATCC 64411 / 73-15) TaxID=644358 RepID=A0A0C4E0C4_MAGP6|nr:hypothetical protein MAPG_05796 [Magnaporthiopsis poae ATCC 64411]